MDAIVKWLLDEKNPSVRYRTMVEFLDLPMDDVEVIKAKDAVLQSKNVKNILNKIDEKGHFPHLPKYYGNFTTFTFLEALSELGLKKDDKNINEIVDWILTPGVDKYEHFIQKEFQNEQAYLLDESNIGSCRQVQFLSTLVKMGFLEDSRVEKLIEAFIGKSKFDGGYLCKWKKSHFSGQLPKSCYRATVQALKLYAELPIVYRERVEYEKLIDYFISRKIIFSKIKQDSIIANTESAFYASGASEIFLLAYSMSRLGLGNIPEMRTLWDILETKRDIEGCVILEQKEKSKKTIIMEDIGMPNKWLTLYMMLSYKYSNRT